MGQIRYRDVETGFTLPELSIVLLVSAALVAAAVAVTQRVQSTSEQSARLSELTSFEKAVRAFALDNARLPCPDTNGDGFEERSCPAGTKVGGLPWASLGLSEPVVPPGRLLRYGVWRYSEADLVTPLSHNPGAVHYSSVKSFLKTLAAASMVPRTDSEPNVTTPTLTNRPGCGTRPLNPAFIVSYEDASTPAAPLCLAGGRDRLLVSVGRYELTGWWLRTAAVGFARD